MKTELHFRFDYLDLHNPVCRILFKAGPKAPGLKYGWSGKPEAMVDNITNLNKIIGVFSFRIGDACSLFVYNEDKKRKKQLKIAIPPSDKAANYQVTERDAWLDICSDLKDIGIID